MGSYDAPHDLEELQLLAQMRAWPVRFRHSATRAIADRLVAAGEAMVSGSATPGDTIIDMTAKGRARLLWDQLGRNPAKACPFCGALPVSSVGSMVLVHPHGSGCILRNFGSSDVAGWNRRVGEFGNG